MNREQAQSVKEGDPIWRWSSNFSRHHPAVIVNVTRISGEVSSFSSRYASSPGERAQVHRVTRSGSVSGVEAMSAADVERMADYQEWRALKFFVVDTGYDRESLTVHEVALRSRVVNAADIDTIRAELDVVGHLMTREAARVTNP